MRKVFWRSWCRFEAGFELDHFKTLPFEHEWVNAHNQIPTPQDIWLTTNGYDYRQGHPIQATLFWESYQYARPEHDRFPNDNRWKHKFHYNPNYCQYPNTSLIGIGCWWKNEKQLYDQIRANKKISHQFGMVLSKKPTEKSHQSDFGWFRTRVVEACKNRSFRYYGCGWSKDDPNYGGEIYVNGSRGSPVKFNDARHLMANCKFVIALDNTNDEILSVNYLTEKIFHAFISYSVPIYAGCWNADKLLGDDIFIDIKKFNYDIKAILDYCENMPDSEYNGYLERINKFMESRAGDFSCESRYLELDRKLSKIFQ